MNYIDECEYQDCEDCENCEIREDKGCIIPEMGLEDYQFGVER